MTVSNPDIQFWFACDLMEPLGYARWENFQAAIQRVIDSCKQRVIRSRTIFVASRK